MLEPVQVADWGAQAWAHPDAVEHARPPQRAAFLGPFDNLIWYRPRGTRLFDFTHTLEAYKPAAQRVHGYYVCPLLIGTRLVGRADLARRGRTLTVLRLSLDALTPDTVDGFATAARDMARIVDCTDITITPEAADHHTRRTLLHALTASG